MIQIFGTKKCKDSQKALRFFKERGVEIQFRDITEKAPSPGELDDMAKAVGGYAALVDLKSHAATALGLAFMDYDARDELLQDPLLLRTPVVRAGKGRAAVGPDEAALSKFTTRMLSPKKNVKQP